MSVRSRQAVVASLLVSTWLWPTHSAGSEVESPPANYLPLADSSEGGLWQIFDKLEKDIAASPLVVRDEALNTYVRKLICDLAGPQCASIRVYVLNLPELNASAAPNGMVIVHTGLLLRAQNEAQLAFILGHEITHYQKRHSLKRFESVRDTRSMLAVFSIATAGAGVGIVGSLASLAATGGLLAYSRDQEREADAGGFDILIAHGYDVRQGAAMMSIMNAEDVANPNNKRGPFFSTHPSSEERVETLTKLADSNNDSASLRELGSERYRALVEPHRGAWLDEELNRGDLKQSFVLINNLVTAEPESGQLRYYLGEVYRRRNAKGDLQNAIDAYRAALNTPDAPVAVYRGLGLAALKSGDKPTARDAFGKYLSLAPSADDRAIIETYITDGQP